MQTNVLRVLIGDKPSEKVLKCRKILQSSRTENALITGLYEKSFSAAPSIRPKLLEQRFPLQVSFFHDNKNDNTTISRKQNSKNAAKFLKIHT